jgi:hypothetical protein
MLRRWLPHGCLMEKNITSKFLNYAVCMSRIKAVWLFICVVTGSGYICIFMRFCSIFLTVWEGVDQRSFRLGRDSSMKPPSVSCEWVSLCINAAAQTKFSAVHYKIVSSLSGRTYSFITEILWEGKSIIYLPPPTVTLLPPSPSPLPRVCVELG